MRLLLIGKDNTLSWTKYIQKTLKNMPNIKSKTIYINKLGYFNDLTRNLKKIISKKSAYKNTAKYIQKQIDTFSPDVILVISPFGMNEMLFQCFKTLKKEIIKIGWIGDLFGLHHKTIADNFDLLCYTDTYFLNLSSKYNFPQAMYLPLGVDPNIFYDMKLKRDDNILFIGASTPYRVEILNNLKYQNIKVIGKTWKNLKPDISVIKKIISIKQVAIEYNSSKYVLNIKNEQNVINGLNMRTFEAPTSGACLVQDYVKDIELNFDIDKELIVYKSIEDLNEQLHRLTRNEKYLKHIVQNAHNRVINNHTYKHRIDKILQTIG